MRTELGDQHANLNDEQMVWAKIRSKASYIIPLFAFTYSAAFFSAGLNRNDTVFIALGCICAQYGLNSIIEGTSKSNLGISLKSKLKSQL